MNVVSFDPGTATGVAVWNDGVFDSCTLDVGGVFDRISNLRGSDVVVCESYAFRSGSEKFVRVYDSLHIIGALKYQCQQLGIELILQSPAEGKGFCDNKRLRLFGCWVKGQTDHERDALRHLCLYLAKQKLIQV